MFKTQDIALAAFLKIEGIPLSDYENQNKKVIFCFDENFRTKDGKTIKDLEIAWQNSAYRKFDYELRALKKIALRR